MHTRVDAGTDVAMVGAWDHGRQDPALAQPAENLTGPALEKEAAEGHLFLIHTGGDGGGPIDIYVDAEAPANVRKKAQAKEGGLREYLLSLPSGKMVVGGVEDYRHPNPRTTTHDSIVTLPPGDYRLRCYIGDHEDSGPITTITEVEQQVLNPADLAYYRGIRKRAMISSVLGYLVFLIFPALFFPFGWKIALGVTLAIALPFFYMLDRWSKRSGEHDPRWERLNKMVERAWLGTHNATFILELHRLEKEKKSQLKGGSIRVA